MLEVGTKILLILVLAGIIGWNRERHGRPAGFRTHILVGIGSTIVMTVSIMMHEKYPSADPARIAAQVISGIGFLGAGTILIQGSTVTGLTTAASIWTTAVIGLAVGAGFYLTAIISALVVFISLFFFTRMEFSKKKIVNQEFIFRLDENSLDFIQKIYYKLEEEGYYIKESKMEKDMFNKEIIISIGVTGEGSQLDELKTWFLIREELKGFSWREH